MRVLLLESVNEIMGVKCCQILSPIDLKDIMLNHLHESLVPGETKDIDHIINVVNDINVYILIIIGLFEYFNSLLKLPLLHILHYLYLLFLIISLRIKYLVVMV